MLYKLEGRKPWAKYEQVGPVETITAKAFQLEVEGWEVKIIPLGNISVEKYGELVLWECLDKLSSNVSHEQLWH